MIRVLAFVGFAVCAGLMQGCQKADEPMEYTVEFPNSNTVTPGVLEVGQWNVEYYQDEMTGDRQAIAVTNDNMSFLKFIHWEKGGSTSLRIVTSSIQDVYEGESHKIEMKFDDGENYVTSAFLSDCDIKVVFFTRCYYFFPDHEKALLLKKLKLSKTLKVRIAGKKVLDFSLAGSSKALREVEEAFQ